MALETLDNQNPKLPGGYTTCSKCNRLVLFNHVNLSGQCSVCEVPVAAVDEPIGVQAVEDLMRDTYPAIASPPDNDEQC